jgi:hypothetical protein
MERDINRSEKRDWGRGRGENSTSSTESLSEGDRNRFSLFLSPFS